MLQAELRSKDARNSDLQENVKSQQAEAAKAKEEQAARDKGKWSSDLSSYAHLNADELHSGFLNRLHSNRDYEAGLVNLMKERYEVNSSPFVEGNLGSTDMDISSFVTDFV